MLIPRVGEQLGDFELIRRIGAGGMGVVYEAREISTGRRVALKILSPAMTRPKNRQRFLREAEAAARLHHPNIVAVYAVHQDAELCYYAMELIEGWPLSRVRELLGVTGPSKLPIPELMRTHSDLDLDADPDAATVVATPNKSEQETIVPPDGSTIEPPAGDQGPAGSMAGEFPPPQPPLSKGGRDGEGLSPAEGGRDARPPAQAAGRKPQAASPGLKSEIRNPKSAILGHSIIGDESYVRQVAAMLRDIARALDYAHGQGVTHRDVKPDNLLLDHAGQLHLVDFGLARVMEEDNITLTGELMGTPLYMSPEQVAAGRIGIDHRTDIYSLGVVLYHLLCLQPPYEAPTREALLRAIVVHAPRPLSARNPAVPRELEAIVHHALEKDPDRRYASAGAMADDLDRWLEGQPISLRLPGPVEQWWNGLSKATRRVVSVSASLALAATAAVVAILLHQPPIPTTQPATPGEAIEQATRAVDEGDYLHGALWYAEAARRGAKDDQLPAMQLASIYDQLTPVQQRVAVVAGEHQWDLHPAKALIALTDPLAGMRMWDLAGGTVPGKAFGPQGQVAWLSYDESGACIWAVEAAKEGEAVQVWQPSGQAVASAPVKVAGHIAGLRTASGPKGYTVAVLTKAAGARPAAASTEPLYDSAIYRLQPDQPPELLLRVPSIRLIELSREGRYLATLSGDEKLEITYLEGQTRSPLPVGYPGSTAEFVFSPARQELALARSSGEISMKDPTDPGARPLGLDLPPAGLRALTAPAYMRFSPDGKYLLVVGTDTQSAPPYLRSIVVVDTRTTKRLNPPTFGWDAYFSADGETLVWWNNEAVTFVDCDETQFTELVRVPAKIAARSEPPREPATTSQAESAWLPVRLDREARRMLCLEATEPAGSANRRISAWDAQTGERLGVLLEAPNIADCAVDATGRFALAQVGTDPSELITWDAGDAQAKYPQCTRLTALPASRDDIRLTRRPLVAALNQEGGRTAWSLTDPASLTPAKPPLPAQGMVLRWLISDDAAVVLQISSDRVSAWDWRDGSLIQNLPVPKAAESVLGLSANGATMAALAPDGVLELREIATGVTTRLGLAERRPTQVRFSPTGRHLAVAVTPAGRIVVCTPEPNSPRVDLETDGPVSQMEFCQDDTLLVVGHTGGRASLWSVRDGRRVATIEPAAPSAQASGAAPVTLPTRIAIRDVPFGQAPPLLATAWSNRIEIRPLPSPAAASQPAADAATTVRPVCLETTQGIVALAFPLCSAAGTGADVADSQPALTTTPAAGPCERLLVITDHAAIRWFDVSMPQRSPAQWRQLITQRTGMELDAAGRPLPIPR